MRFYNTICRSIMISDRMAAYLAVQDEFHAMKMAGRLTDCFQAATEAIVKSPAASLSGAWTAMLGDFLKVYETRDYVALHDVCTLMLRPMCVRILEELRRAGQWQEVLDLYSCNYEAADQSTRQMLDLYGIADASDIPDRYQLAETQTGSFTLKLVRSDRTITFHSEDNPFEEARQLADRYCDGQHSRYLLLGFGMGYLADALDKREDIAEIVVCEPDLFLLKAAFHYADLSSLLTDGKVHIVYDKKLVEFARRLSGGTPETAGSRRKDDSCGVVIHRPSLANIDNKQLRQRLEDYYIQDSSIRSQRRLLDGNFKRNIAELESDRQGEIRCVSDAETLRKVFAGRRVLFLAAGPSLEDHLDWLASQSAEYIITEYGDGGVRSYPYEAAGEEYLVVCVGTVLRGLMGIGVQPDYVVMTDPQDNMLSQTAGIDTAPLSLIYIPTLYYQVPKQWQGKKYIALQQGYHLSEQYAKEHGRMLFETGGSVSTFALDVFLKLGVSEIVCLGLDLAYTDGFRHAGNSGLSVQDDSARKVKAVGGGLVATALNLDNYRLWIERRLSRRTAAERSAVLRNISRGAYINGMENSTTFM